MIISSNYRKLHHNSTPVIWMATKVEHHQFLNLCIHTEQDLRHHRCVHRRPSIASGIRNPSLGCLYRRTDGVVVRLTCPNCQRSNFSSAQGFLNHSRIAHSKEYTSQDAAALKCGDILPEIKQDLTGEASIKMLVERDLIQLET